DRRADGRLRAGGYPVRVPDGPSALQGPDGAGDADAGGGRGSGAAPSAEHDGATGPGNHLPEVLAEGPGPALPDCARTGGGPTAVPGRRADPGAAGEMAGARVALVPAE